jgi:hypothetical protein
VSESASERPVGRLAEFVEEIEQDRCDTTALRRYARVLLSPSLSKLVEALVDALNRADARAQANKTAARRRVVVTEEALPTGPIADDRDELLRLVGMSITEWKMVCTAVALWSPESFLTARLKRLK